MNKRQLFAQLKRTDQDLKRLNERYGGACEMAINDGGAAIDRVQKLINEKLDERDKIVEQIKALG